MGAERVVAGVLCHETEPHDVDLLTAAAARRRGRGTNLQEHDLRDGQNRLRHAPPLRVSHPNNTPPPPSHPKTLPQISASPSHPNAGDAPSYPGYRPKILLPP